MSVSRNEWKFVLLTQWGVGIGRDPYPSLLISASFYMAAASHCSCLDLVIN